jgi:hypothetical protein
MADWKTRLITIALELRSQENLPSMMVDKSAVVSYQINRRCRKCFQYGVYVGFHLDGDQTTADYCFKCNQAIRTGTVGVT